VNFRGFGRVRWGGGFIISVIARVIGSLVDFVRILKVLVELVKLILVRLVRDRGLRRDEMRDDILERAVAVYVCVVI